MNVYVVVSETGTILGVYETAARAEMNWTDAETIQKWPVES